MASTGEAQQAIIDAIVRSAADTTHPPSIAKLAEAYAWAISPNNSHGGGIDDGK